MKGSLLFVALTLVLAASVPAEAKRYSLHLSFGQDVEVVKTTGVSMRAQCIQNEMGGDVARFYAATENNALLRGNYSSYLGNGSYLTSATPASVSNAAMVFHPPGVEHFSGVIDSGWVLNLTTMRGFAFSAESAVLATNNGAFDCTMSIDIVPIKKFKVPKP